MPKGVEGDQAPYKASRRIGEDAEAESREKKLRRRKKKAKDMPGDTELSCQADPMRKVKERIVAV